MAYNKASEERKWHYWKEREEKKLRELGMDEEKIRKLRQMDWEDFLEERKRLNFRHGYKNPRPHFCNRSTLIIHI